MRQLHPSEGAAHGNATSSGSELDLVAIAPIHCQIVHTVTHRHISKYTSSLAKGFRAASVNYGHGKGQKSTDCHPHSSALSALPWVC